MPRPPTPGSPEARRRSRPRAEAGPPASGYTTREVADVLDLPTSRIHTWVRHGLLRPARGPRNEYVFSFQDLAVLRAAEELLEADLPTRRVREALTRVQELLPAGRPLSAVQLTALGGRVLVREAGSLWDPDTGQLQVAFQDTDASAEAPGAEAGVRSLEEAARTTAPAEGEEWFDRGVELEDTDEAAARAAYRQALERDPSHADAYVNLGRLLHEAGELDEAELQYRAALSCRDDHARAWHNLGVLLEDRSRSGEALEAYERALAADEALAPAHWNMARLHEAAGREPDALRHLAAYKRLVEGRSR